MTETTLEEARRCPKCEQPGVLNRKEPAPRGATPGSELHVYMCDNSRCRWYKQVCRLITVRPDGTIPSGERRAKEYPAIPDLTERVNAQLAAQLEAERTGKAEINPR